MADSNDPPQRARRLVDFGFRDKLDSFAEGFRHNYCYQCGACVADCPAHQYTHDFNPRLIILKAILGFEDELVRADSEIWNCTNCYTCSERCPQDVRPVDVIIALKNMCVAEHKAPAAVTAVSDSVLETGITTKATGLVARRREEFGLARLADRPVGELHKLLGEGAS